MDKPPTLGDLARLLGLSVATVSRALRNDINVSQKNRETVQRTARELGYQRDANTSLAYARLRIKRVLKDAPILAVLTMYRGESEWKSNPYFVRFMEHVRNRAAELGYQINAFSLREPGVSARRLTGILRARGIEGIMVAPDFPSGGHLSLDLSHFAAAACSNTVWRPSLHRAESHGFHNTLLALRHLSRLGYKRIGLASFFGDARNSMHQKEGAYLYCASTGVVLDPIPTHSEGRPKSGAFLSWVKEHRPDAILATQLEATLDDLSLLKLRPGLDIGLASLGVPPGSGWAGINLHADKIDATVVDLVVDQLHRNERGVPEHPRIVMVEGSWTDGSTVRDVSKRRTRSRLRGRT